MNIYKHYYKLKIFFSDKTPILLSHISCTATDLESCRSWKLGGGNCRHEQDLFLECSNSPLILNEISASEPTFEDGTCIKDNRLNRVLDGKVLVNAAEMSKNICQNFCFQYKYFGMENGHECFCGNTFKYFIQEPYEQCQSPCRGHEGEICGGSNRLNVYHNDN